MQWLSQLLMNIMNIVTESSLQRRLFTLHTTEQRCRVSGALTLPAPGFTKERVALFPGIESNWCVYTINDREQSTFSGEIWTT